MCVRSDNLEDLTKTMTQSGGIGSGFGMFRECLRYKLARQGKALIAVDRYTPTTRTCSACGAVLEEAVSRRRRTWTCPACGTTHSREINAAKNVKAQGLARYLSTQELRDSA